jgi:uncharacterized protein (TIGR03083 family)
MEAELRAEVQDLARAWQVDIRLMVRDGDPMRQLAAVAAEQHADAIVVGSSGRSRHWLAGSGTARLMRHSDRPVTVVPGATAQDLVEALAARVDARTAPPGPAASWLGETIVHGEDVFRALGGYRDHPTAHVVAVADFYQNSNLLIGTKKRIAGLTLRATDTSWQHGSGPEVAGPILALLLAMTGRATALEDLTGDGVGLLRQRG